MQLLISSTDAPSLRHKRIQITQTSSTSLFPRLKQFEFSQNTGNIHNYQWNQCFTFLLPVVHFRPIILVNVMRKVFSSKRASHEQEQPSGHDPKCSIDQQRLRRSMESHSPKAGYRQTSSLTKRSILMQPNGTSPHHSPMNPIQRHPQQLSNPPIPLPFGAAMCTLLSRRASKHKPASPPWLLVKSISRSLRNLLSYELRTNAEL